jgi:hypothetical protein
LLAYRLSTVVTFPVRVLTIALHAGARRGSVAVYMVYRRKNVAHVQRILGPCFARGWGVHLWALDEVAPELRTWTRGAGPGPKFALCNRLLDLAPERDAETVVISDDDIAFEHGNLAVFVDVMNVAGLEFAQPAHESYNNAAHAVTFRQRRALARLTSFVEIGPVFAISGSIRHKILPFPDDAGMGWGLDLVWAQLADEGVRLGVVDAVSFNHLIKPGLAYDKPAARLAMEAMLSRRGIPLTDWWGATAARWPSYLPFAPRTWRVATPGIPERARRQSPDDTK